MDFFAEQDRARRASRWLLAWFLLAVAASVAVVYLALALPLAGEDARIWQPGLFSLVAFGVGGTILAGSAWKVAQLAAGGGAAVAESLGGRLIPRASTDPAERRLINLADEMAVAAGIPAPPVYVLDQETGINAFAAGSRPQQAVVAVTRGALEKLSRDELQGVVAHEFSHILNGDMRLNLRLIGVLHGLFMLATAGRVLLRGGSRGSGRNRGGIVALGLALLVAGHVGMLAGRIIRAAVSRQREFLADASAVQFTRNPAGIAGALRRIADEGAALASPRADEVSHMLFDTGKARAGFNPFTGWLASHPPLAERIRRIEGGRLSAAVAQAPVTAEAAGAVPGLAPAHTAPPSTPRSYAESIGAPAADRLDGAREVIATLPESLRDAVARPEGARAVALALLLARTEDTRRTQIELLARREGEAFAQAMETALPAPPPPGLRLPLIELALGSLRELPADARGKLLATAEALARADGRVSLAEYMLLRLMRDALAPRIPSPLRTTPGELVRHWERLLALLAHAGSRDPETARAAFARGAALAPSEHLVLLPLGGIDSDTLDAALDRLATAPAAYRRRLVESLAATAWHDGRLAPAEAELLATFCGALDCPAPLTPPTQPTATGTAPAAPAPLAAASPRADVELSRADRLPLQALITANLIPVFGVLFLAWDAMTVLLTYWLENLVIGVYTYVRMARIGGWRTLFMPGLFFLFHFGFFCAGHGMVLLGLSALSGLEIDHRAYIGADEWPGPFVVFQELSGILGWIIHERPEMVLALLGFFLSHGISTFIHQFIRDEDRGREVEEIMFDPYKRIVVLHLVILAGAFVVILSGGASLAPVLLLLSGGKIALDLHLHRQAHAARQAAHERGRDKSEGETAINPGKGEK